MYTIYDFHPDVKRLSYLTWLLFAAGIGAVLYFGLKALFLAAWRASEARPHTYAVALGDLDGDGDLDAFYANGKNEGPQANTVSLNGGGVQGGQPGTFGDSGQRLGSELSREVSLADLDGDRDLDALLTGFPLMSVWLNAGDGQFTAGRPLADSFIGKWIAAPGDLDGDGDLDLIKGGCCSPSGNSNSVWFNQGGAQGGSPGDFLQSGQELENLGAEAVALGDLDGDGDLDAFFGNNFVTGAEGEIFAGQPDTVWWNDGRGGLVDSGQRLGQAATLAAALGDLDSDGDLDAYSANHGPDEVWLNAGGRQGGQPGLLEDSGQRLGKGNSRQVFLKDLDGDGDLEAAVVTRDCSFPCFVSTWARLQIWSNDGLGNFSPSRERIVYPRAAPFDLGDLDGDGDLDVFAGWFESGYTIWWNQGEGNFSR